MFRAKHAVVARPPVVLGQVKTFDEAAAMKVPGVIKVVKIPSTPMPAVFAPLGGVAVIADSTWAAIKGREALKIEWDDGPHASYDSIAYRKELEAASLKPGKVERNEGDVGGAGRAAKVVEHECYIPHGVHVPMDRPGQCSDQGWES